MDSFANGDGDDDGNELGDGGGEGRAEDLGAGWAVEEVLRGPARDLDRPEDAPVADAGRTASSPRQRPGGLIDGADQSRGHGRGGGWLQDSSANNGSTQPRANSDADPQGRGRGRGKGRGKGCGGGRRGRRGGKPGGGGDDDGDDDDPGGAPHPGGDPSPSDPSSSPRDRPPRDPWDRQRNNFAAWVWEQLDEVSLPEAFAQDVVTTVDPPFIIRKDYIQIQGYALQRFYDTHTEEGFGREDQERAYKLHLLVSRMLLARTEEHGHEGRAIFQDRVRKLYRGDWLSLLREAQRPRVARAEDLPGQPQQAAQSSDAHAAMRTAYEEEEWLFASVIQQVRRGELSRAAKKLVASPLAPGPQETLNKLADPRRRPTRLFRPLREEDLQYAPPDLMLRKQKFLENVRSAKRGSAPGRCGTRHEHYRVLLEDIRATDNLYFLAQKLAVGDVPESIRRGLAVAHLTALQKVNETGAPTGDVRGIATGIVLRRLVARTIAQQFSDAVLRATSPFQFALSTRAGVDCVALMTKLLTDMDDDTTVASLDGIGAYDHVSRACFLEELRENPELAPLLPFVRLWYSRPSTYTWRDEHNTVHSIPQAEGVEQGDPLSPLLFSLAVHASLRHANESLREGEYLFAFLDDVYTVTPKNRATAVARMVASRIHEHAGVEPKLGKFQIWSKGGGPEPEGIDELLEGAPRPADPIWTGDLEAERNGMVILGTPVGSPEFVQRFLGNRLDVQTRFWDRLKQVPDLQAAWLLLLYCAVPRANHLIRAIPPNLVANYAQAHDDGIWATFLDLIGHAPRPARDPAHEGAEQLPLVRDSSQTTQMIFEVRKSKR